LPSVTSITSLLASVNKFFNVGSFFNIQRCIFATSSDFRKLSLGFFIRLTGMLKKSATVWYGATSLSSLYVTSVTSTSLSAMLSCTSVTAASLTLGIILNGSIAFASGFVGVSVTATSSAATPLASSW
jgi:hypothetical protein